MAIPFARTLRSLNADRFRTPRLVWIAAIVLLCAWGWWFFQADIPDPAAPGMRTTPARLIAKSVGLGLAGTTPE